MDMDRGQALSTGELAKQLRNASAEEEMDPFYDGAVTLVITMAAEALTKLNAIDGARDPEMVKSLDWYADMCRGCRQRTRTEEHRPTCDWQ